MSTFGACVPNYNYARYLPRCLEALAAQTRPIDEIVIVDDASTDNSLEIIESYRSRFRKMVVVRNATNLGCNESLNIALRLISTDYTSTSATDDWLEPQFFERLSGMLERHPKADLAVCATVCWDEDKNTKWISGHLKAKGPCYLSPDELILSDAEDRFAIFGNTVIARVARMRELGGFDARLIHAADTYVWLSLLFEKGMCYDPEPLANIRLSRTSFSGRTVANRKTKTAALEALVLKCKEEGSPALWRGLRESGNLVHAGKDAIGVILSRPEYWSLLSWTFIRRYILWNWWRVCDRYLQQSWLHQLQPKIPILERKICG